uniref:AlNc14C272G9979 protein n=1 Tax=Albugo laibachii Nc14 TaxID=890382 RepID=F0WUG6_9STRA|nr:AlNc14C272G9979 [Albugo laibachii Nc14]|eukprot:CCA25046.1 AlNc14C272G9979 [Albugo laibachii Nc14]
MAIPFPSKLCMHSNSSLVHPCNLCRVIVSLLIELKPNSFIQKILMYTHGSTIRTYFHEKTVSLRYIDAMVISFIEIRDKSVAHGPRHHK